MKLHIHGCPLCYDVPACSMGCSVDYDDDGRLRGAHVVCDACLARVARVALELANVDPRELTEAQKAKGGWVGMQGRFQGFSQWISPELPEHARALRMMLLEISNRLINGANEGGDWARLQAWARSLGAPEGGAS